MGRNFPSDAFPIVVAHRGASSTHPENTLPSFAAALELGAPMVEFDVRLTADGVPVVMHDPDVSRTTDGEGLVHELTAAEVATLEAGTPEQPAGVPLLGEVLALVSGRAAVAIEIKNIPGDPGYEKDGESVVEAALAEVGRTAFAGPVLVLSFNLRSIATARAIATDVATGFLTTELIDPREALAHAVEVGHDFVLPGTRSLLPAGETFVSAAHAAGVRVGTWTVDDPQTLRTLLDWGVDAIASNDPGMALAVLAQRREG
jgi:glycerophosphoryl diester phosphodiesterase